MAFNRLLVGIMRTKVYGQLTAINTAPTAHRPSDVSYAASSLRTPEAIARLPCMARPPA
jgi:hypothetical protein